MGSRRQQKVLLTYTYKRWDEQQKETDRHFQNHSKRPVVNIFLSFVHSFQSVSRPFTWRSMTVAQCTTSICDTQWIFINRLVHWTGWSDWLVNYRYSLAPPTLAPRLVKACSQHINETELNWILVRGLHCEQPHLNTRADWAPAVLHRESKNKTPNSWS